MIYKLNSLNTQGFLSLLSALVFFSVYRVLNFL